MSTQISDITKPGTSSCCDAKVYLGDICKACGEHCDAIVICDMCGKEFGTMPWCLLCND